jgi:predicted 2-oxoglutarate/Fe(II)-dependent dioxygenase YbiX
MPEYTYITDKIFTVAHFFSAEECAATIALAESLGFTDAPVNSSLGPQIRKDVRNNTRVMLDDPEQARDLWARIGDNIPQRLGVWTACGVNERFRFYRYEVGQQFDWHYDGAFERDNGERSQLTFMIYLNDGFAGGQTTIENISIVPQQGMALFFVHEILHKGQPVLDGRKYVLRTDVMYRYG